MVFFNLVLSNGYLIVDYSVLSCFLILKTLCGLHKDSANNLNNNSLRSVELN